MLRRTADAHRAAAHRPLDFFLPPRAPISVHRPRMRMAGQTARASEFDDDDARRNRPADDVHGHALRRLASSAIACGDVRRRPLGEAQQAVIVVECSRELDADWKPLRSRESG